MFLHQAHLLFENIVKTGLFLETLVNSYLYHS